MARVLKLLGFPASVILIGMLFFRDNSDFPRRLLSNDSSQVHATAPTPNSIRVKSQEFVPPADSGYVNVKDFGAKGDGITDDTAAFKQVFGRNKKDPGGAIREIFIPNGTYLLSDTIAWGDKKKDVIGESRDGVILKLKDSSPGFNDPEKPKKLLSTEFDFGGQNFNQRIRNLTIEIGRGNPGAIGLGFHTNNGGGVSNVVIRSTDPEKLGHTGLSLDKPWPGPGLIKNVYIDGFDTGIFITHDQYGMTFEHLILANQRRVGFVNSWNTVAIRNLKSYNRVPAIENRGKMALMALLDSELVGGTPEHPAILNHKEGALFARNLKTQGYRSAITNQSGQEINLVGPNVAKFVSHQAQKFSPLNQQLSWLPVEEPPLIPYGDVKQWKSVIQFGAKPGDRADDGPAIQRAIDAGGETVYLPAGVYRSKQSIFVRGNVRRILGLNARLIFDLPGKPAFIIKDGKHPEVALDVESDYGSEFSYWIEHASRRTLVFRNGSYHNTVTGGKVFIEDNVAVPLHFNRQQVWIRQINTESYQHNPQIVNRGGQLWILGLKTEKDRTIIGTYEGGRTEMFGGLLYKNNERLAPVPAFIAEASKQILIYRNKGLPYQTQIQESHRGITQTLSVKDLPASNGRMPLYIGGSRN